MTWRKTLQIGCAAALATAQLAYSQSSAARSSVTEGASPILINTFLDSGNPQTTLSVGNTTLETAQTNCLYGTRCTLAMTIMASVGAATCTKEWAIIGLVDGNAVDSEPLQNPLPHDGNQQTARWQGAAKLSHGDHTATFQIYVPCPATAEQWSVKYDLTVP